MNKVEMSSEAVTRRLRQSSDLRDLCLALMKAPKKSRSGRTSDAIQVLDKVNAENLTLSELTDPPKC